MRGIAGRRLCLLTTARSDELLKAKVLRGGGGSVLLNHQIMSCSTSMYSLRSGLPKIDILYDKNKKYVSFNSWPLKLRGHTAQRINTSGAWIILFWHELKRRVLFTTGVRMVNQTPAIDWFLVFSPRPYFAQVTVRCSTFHTFSAACQKFDSSGCFEYVWMDALISSDTHQLHYIPLHHFTTI